MIILLVRWQFNSGNQIKLNSQSEYIQVTRISNQLPLALEYVNTGDNSSSVLKSNKSNVLTNNVSSTSLPTDNVSKSATIQIEPQPEFYQNIERFSAEDKQLRMNTTFKRILFWNDEVSLNNIYSSNDVATKTKILK
jgi:hypothetical protein